MHSASVVICTNTTCISGFRHSDYCRHWPL